MPPEYWIHIEYILNTYWTYIEHILNAYWTHVEYILNIYWRYVEYILNVYRTHVKYILNIYWIHIERMLNTYWTYIEDMLNTYWTYIERTLNTYWTYIEYILNVYWRYVQYVEYIYWRCIDNCQYMFNMLKLTFQYVECTLQYIMIHMLHICCTCIARGTMQHQNVYKWDSGAVTRWKFIFYRVHKTINLPNSLSYTKLAKRTLPKRHFPSWIKPTRNTAFIVESSSWRHGRAEIWLRILLNHFTPICFRKTKHND